MCVAGNSTRSQTAGWGQFCCLLAALCGSATAILPATADPGGGAMALQAGPMHMSVAVDEPDVQQRLVPPEPAPAEPVSRPRLAAAPVKHKPAPSEPSATRLPSTAPRKFKLSVTDPLVNLMNSAVPQTVKPAAPEPAAVPLPAVVPQSVKLATPEPPADPLPPVVPRSVRPAAPARTANPLPAVAPQTVKPAVPDSPAMLPAAVPQPVKLAAAEPAADRLPAVTPQMPPRREVWSRDVVTAAPTANRGGAVQTVAQAPPRRSLPAPEDVPSGPIAENDNDKSNGNRLPFDDDIKPLSAARNNLQPAPGEMPTDYAQARFEDVQPIIGGSEADRQPTGVVYLWEATALCFQPIYIEDVNLERYGYSHGVLQPFVSAVHFFGTIPLLPYKMGMHPESECIYSLGYYRPGTPAPYQTSRLGWSWRGAICEAGAIGAVIAWIPSGKFY